MFQRIKHFNWVIASSIVGLLAQNLQAAPVFCAKNDGVLGRAENIDDGDTNKKEKAIVCGMNHYTRAPWNVNTKPKWTNEIANTISHEYGHLLGLEHSDGSSTTLMDGAYDGINKGFGATELTELDALAAGVRKVWLDFSALSLVAKPWGPLSDAGQIDVLGFTPAELAALPGDIKTLVEADYAAVTGGATFAFSLTPPEGDYTTIAIVPEPMTLMLLALGAAPLFRRRRIR